MAARKTRAAVLCVIPALVCAGISVEPSCNTGPDGNDAACAQRSGQSVLQKKSDVREQSSSATDMGEDTSSAGRWGFLKGIIDIDRFFGRDKRPGLQTPCRDHDTRCMGWGQLGHCNKTYVGFMKANCSKTCHWCSPPVREACGDFNTACHDWANYGYCYGEHGDYMKKHCPEACGYCQPPKLQWKMEQPQGMHALANLAALSHEGLPEPEPQMEESQDEEGVTAFEIPAGLLQKGSAEPEPQMEQPKDDDGMNVF